MYRQTLFVAATLISFYARCHAYSPREIYVWLNDEDKGNFLRFYLAKGIVNSSNGEGSIFPYGLNLPTDCIKKFQKLAIEPNNFPILFMNKFMEKYNVSATEALGWAKGEIICFPNGECVDLGDVGSICCTYEVKRIVL